MQVLLVRSFLAVVFAPLMVYFCMRVIIRYSATRGPKYWWAVGAAMYAVIAIILGISQGAGAGGELGAMLALAERGNWLASMAGGALSVTLSLWVIVVQYARLRAMLPPPEAGQ